MAANAARPWLSILVPVYNAAPYVRQFLQSLAAQAWDGVELVMLDDASSDASLSLLQHTITELGLPAQVLGLPANSGVSVARNTLLEAAQGEYLWFLDADDLIVPQAVQTIRQSLERYRWPDLLMFDFQMLRPHMQLKHRLRGELHRKSFAGPPHVRLNDRNAIIEGLFLQGQFHPWSKVSRRQCWGQAGSGGLRFVQGKVFGEDMAAFSRLALRVRDAVYVPEPLVRYRLHPGNVMASMTWKKAADMCGALLDFAQDLQALQTGHRQRGQSGHGQQQAPWQPNAQSAWAISHVAYRNFAGALRYLHGSEYAQSPHNPQMQQELVQMWRASSPLSPAQLLTGYRRKGWFMRYWHARKTLKPWLDTEHI